MARTSPPPKQRKLDLTSVAGVPVAVGLILAGQWLEGGSFHSLLQGAAALIVFGGTLGAVLLSFSLADVRRAAVSLRAVFFEPSVSADETIRAILHFARVARKDGILALEDQATTVKDPLLRKGLMLAVDGLNPKTLREMLDVDIETAEEQDLVPARVYESAGGYAPTVGILGAVLGLIHVMQSLSDPSKLGAGIAVAFVATIYGVGAANLILLPIATKLRHRASEAALRRVVIAEGIMAIQEGLNPRLIDQKLHGFVGAESMAPVKGRAA